MSRLKILMIKKLVAKLMSKLILKNKHEVLKLKKLY